ncbi:hypothetical protein N0B31_10585 [Salinirubellus salinus]|jgi:hypothetical protein|uniref:C2H2-type domain-containing protein n=1 Tax=Salinirubellus salinus TaxID=1364945 RepID=A0A9E7R6C3_9EURY|nr:hypothetical protein [Salinirubellus salinus]UWM56721.1 hypothetical protein N0B31_10585 [Salinirubellus salinus]
MADCDYCGASFDGEVPDSHLRSEHLEELGPIDRRRIGDAEDDGGLPTGPIALVVVIGLAAALVAYVVFFTGSSAAGVGPVNSDHYHGDIEVTVLGDTVDFSQQQYQLQDRRFHFEGGSGEQWHAHASDVTLGFGMEALGFDVTRNSFTYEGTTYEDGSEYDVSVTVNGNAVGPGYTLQDGDSIVITVERA